MKSSIQEKSTNVYSVEFFHIYTDERINGRHIKGLDYLKAIERTWSFTYDRIVLIDDYNPTKSTLTITKVLEFLKSKNMEPKYWALESDLVKNAKIFLELVTDKKLRQNYKKYIDKYNKYPCSLLTATWYLTRMGYFNSKGVIHPVKKSIKYRPATRLLNLLPQDYQTIENKALKLILESNFAETADKIQDIFYPVDSGRASDLF